jgi:hypothetical protein
MGKEDTLSERGGVKRGFKYPLLPKEKRVLV